MPRQHISTLLQPVLNHDPEQEIVALSEQTMRVILVARALTDSARPVDLGGLEGQIGLLCAKALDLPPARTGFAKLELHRLVRSLDELKTAMRNDFA